MIECYLDWVDGRYTLYQATGDWVGNEDNILIEVGIWEAYQTHLVADWEWQREMSEIQRTLDKRHE